MQDSTLECLSENVTFGDSGDMAGTLPDVDQAAKRMEVPLWGRLLIRVLKWAGGLIVAGFIAIVWQLISLNRDIGRIEGEIKNLPQSLSAQLLKQSEKSAQDGHVEQATHSLDTATALIRAARDKRQRIAAGYFNDTSRQLEQIALLSPSGELRDSVHQAFIQLAIYRSAIEPSPSLAGPQKTIDAPTAASSIQGAEVIHVRVHGDFVMPPVVRTLANAPTFFGGIFVGDFADSTQTLDGFRWINSTFVRFKIRYDGGEVELQNVRFVDCTFELPNDTRGNAVAAAIANLSPKLLIPG